MVKKGSEQAREVRRNMRGGAGEVTIRHYFNKDEFGASCRLCAQLVIAPGAGIGLHQHNDEDEIFIIEQGRGVVVDGDKEVEVESGDSVLTGKGGAHSIKNTGDKDLLVTAIIIPY